MCLNMKMEVDNNNVQPIQQIKFAYGQEWRRINFSGHSFEGLCTEVKKVQLYTSDVVK